MVEFIKLKLMFYIIELCHFLKGATSITSINCELYKNLTIENRFMSDSVA